MEIELTKDIAIDLLISQSTSYSNFELPICKECGVYSGSYNTWQWNVFKLGLYSTEDIYDLYLTLKNQY